MMERKIQNREKRRLKEIVKEYLSKGYEVRLEPTVKERPSFLRNYKPDLVAISPNDNVVIEVKTSSSLKAKQTAINRLAKIIDNQPNWRFELIVTNPRFEEAKLLSILEIKDGLDKSRKLLKQGFPDASLVLAWGAIEAMLRRALSKTDIRRISALKLVKTAYSLGFVNKQQFEVLERCVEFRNKIIHGFGYESNLDKVADKLLGVGRSLLDKTKDNF